MKQITNIPPKGTADWMPDEFQIRKYIFDTWREVCGKFGYKEYLTPIVEYADIYRAKSGEDIGGKELTIFEDRGGRELAIRPEMTPSVTRMVSRFYDAAPKPLRLFSIANFFRNEKPQRGRNREFWQLNFDVFGSNSVNADIEILSMGVEIMAAFGADRTMYKILINDKRVLAEIIRNYLGVSETSVQDAVRVLDKYGKISDEELKQKLMSLGAAPFEWDMLFELLKQNKDSVELLKRNYLSKELLLEIDGITSTIKKLYDVDIEWNPSLARGFDYYDGMVFEVFDKNPENARSLFGGGRYNGLAGIFGGNSFPAVGCAPGDETTRLFLESWNLLDNAKLKMQNEKFYIPLLDESLSTEVSQLAVKLRNEGKRVETGLEVERLGKALDFANKNQIDKVIIFGTNEKESGIYKIKDMKTGEEKEDKL